MSRSSNYRLTCICVFAEAKRKAKFARKLHKKGAVGYHPSNFRDKINVKLKRGLVYFLNLPILSLISICRFFKH